MTRGAREGAVDYHPALREMTLDQATRKRRGAAEWRINRAPFVGTTLADSGRANSCAVPALSEAGEGTRREERKDNVCRHQPANENYERAGRRAALGRCAAHF